MKKVLLVTPILAVGFVGMALASTEGHNPSQESDASSQKEMVNETIAHFGENVRPSTVKGAGDDAYHQTHAYAYNAH